LKNINSDAVETLLKEGTWSSEIQIPKNSSSLKPDGTINYEFPIKVEYLEKLGILKEIR
jgi:hypothetical protein